ncbi:MAG: methyltransferase [Clostridia bacterium]|nr:methyltransferase [Clostridia bacterium]
MNSRERLLNALNHQKTDKIPVDFGATSVTGMNVNVVIALREFYGLERRLVKVHEPYQMLGLIDSDLQEVLKVDVKGVFGKNTLFGFPNENWKEWRTGNGTTVLVPEKFNTTVDSEGNIFIYPEGDTTVKASGRMPKGGYYFDAIIRQDEIDEDHLSPSDNLEEFTIIKEEDLTYFKDSIQTASKTGMGVMVSFGGTALGDIALVPGTFMKHPKGIRDIEEWYVSTVTRQSYLHEIFERQTDIALINLEKLNKAAGDLIDVLFICGTDFGTQTGTFCSPLTFNQLYLPYYQKINNWIHDHTSWKTFKHSCGAVESFIPLFIEAGFDILNPVQCSATGMEPDLLKKRYGNDIVFWGGGIDTQKVLPFGTPQDVKAQVLERCRIFSENGGYVFNAIHNIQANTPVKNITAMIEAVHEFNR